MSDVRHMEEIFDAVSEQNPDTFSAVANILMVRHTNRNLQIESFGVPELDMLLGILNDRIYRGESQENIKAARVNLNKELATLNVQETVETYEGFFNTEGSPALAMFKKFTVSLTTVVQTDVAGIWKPTKTMKVIDPIDVDQYMPHKRLFPDAYAFQKMDALNLLLQARAYMLSKTRSSILLRTKLLEARDAMKLLGIAVPQNYLAFNLTPAFQNMLDSMIPGCIVTNDHVNMLESSYYKAAKREGGNGTRFLLLSSIDFRRFLMEVMHDIVQCLA